MKAKVQKEKKKKWGMKSRFWLISIWSDWSLRWDHTLTTKMIDLALANCYKIEGQKLCCLGLTQLAPYLGTVVLQRLIFINIYPTTRPTYSTRVGNHKNLCEFVLPIIIGNVHNSSNGNTFECVNWSSLSLKFWLLKPYATRYKV